MDDQERRRHEKSWNDPPLFSYDQLNKSTPQVPLHKRYSRPMAPEFMQGGVNAYQQQHQQQLQQQLQQQQPQYLQQQPQVPGASQQNYYPVQQSVQAGGWYAPQAAYQQQQRPQISEFMQGGVNAYPQQQQHPQMHDFMQAGVNAYQQQQPQLQQQQPQHHQQQPQIPGISQPNYYPVHQNVQGGGWYAPQVAYQQQHPEFK